MLVPLVGTAPGAAFGALVALAVPVGALVAFGALDDAALGALVTLPALGALGALGALDDAALGALVPSPALGAFGAFDDAAFGALGALDDAA